MLKSHYLFLEDTRAGAKSYILAYFLNGKIKQNFRTCLWKEGIGWRIEEQVLYFFEYTLTYRFHFTEF